MNLVRDARVKLRSLLLTALIRVPSTAISSRPNRSSSRHSSTNVRKTCRKALRLSRRKSAMVLKSGWRWRSSQITSRFRPASLQAPAGADPIEVAVDVELGQIRRRIAWPTCCFGLDPSKAGRLQVEPIHEGLDEPHRIVRTDVVVDGLRQEQHLGAVVTGNVCHGADYPTPGVRRFLSR